MSPDPRRTEDLYERSGEMSEDDAELAQQLRLLIELAATSGAQSEAARKKRAEVAAAVAAWGERAERPAVDVPGLAPAQAALVREGLDVLAAWVRAPGAETNAAVDAMIQRLEREFGPPLTVDRGAERAADQERLRVRVRGNIAAKLREAQAEREAREGRDGSS